MVDLSDEIDEDTLPSEYRREAMRDWIRYLFEERGLLDPISFDRADNKTYTVEQIVGFVAEAAKDHGLRSAGRLAPWHYDEEEIPTADLVEKLFLRYNKNDIVEIFEQVNKRFISIAKDYGFFTHPYSYAYDTTWVSWDPEADDTAGITVIDEEEAEELDGWLFATVAVVDLEGRFAFGVNFIDERDQVPEHLKNLMRTVAEEVEIGQLMMDSGLYGGDAVSKCRSIAGENWMIRGKKDHYDEDRNSVMGRLLEETPEEERDYETNIDFSDVTPGPNAIVVPTRDDDNYSYTHAGFLTDLDPKEFVLTDKYWEYRKRSSIEDTIRNLKHEFGVKSEHKPLRIRLFLFNFASLFYNIHSTMNRALAPKTAVPMDVKFDEVLQAIVDYVFTPHRELD